ncbi:MAG: hypothetical protein ABS34_07920 [Opitutaceae bacterium BACL24 MAG-120322-bin51]|jgi:flagellar protein FliO/FliZ|nr:MAG: hypothetical protein ABS34_07920 [Opitutaceae bacterium BACL24 MAG-120322-bin51]
MSEESGEPIPSKLKLSSSRNQPEKPQSALSASAPSSVTASLPKKIDTSPLETPIAASKPAPVLKATPPVLKATPPVLKATPPVLTATPPALEATPPVLKATPPVLTATPPALAQNPAPRTSDSASKKVTEPATPTTEAPEKDNPLSSILIVAAILFILAAAAGGIWFLLRSDEPELVEGTETAALAAAPSNSVERAEATIATVPDRNLDKVLDTESAPEPSNEAAPEPSQAEPSAPIPTSLKESVSKYLQNIHIGGIRTGERARIMLDGENYNINDTVDAATGLVFIGTRDQRLLFKDSNGTIYVKSF